MTAALHMQSLAQAMMDLNLTQTELSNILSFIPDRCNTPSLATAEEALSRADQRPPPVRAAFHRQQVNK